MYMRIRIFFLAEESELVLTMEDSVSTLIAPDKLLLATQAGEMYVGFWGSRVYT